MTSLVLSLPPPLMLVNADAQRSFLLVILHPPSAVLFPVLYGRRLLAPSPKRQSPLIPVQERACPSHNTLLLRIPTAPSVAGLTEHSSCPPCPLTLRRSCFTIRGPDPHLPRLSSCSYPAKNNPRQVRSCLHFANLPFQPLFKTAKQPRLLSLCKLPRPGQVPFSSHPHPAGPI